MPVKEAMASMRAQHTFQSQCHSKGIDHLFERWEAHHALNRKDSELFDEFDQDKTITRQELTDFLVAYHAYLEQLKAG